MEGVTQAWLFLADTVINSSTEQKFSFSLSRYKGGVYSQRIDTFFLFGFFI